MRKQKIGHRGTNIGDMRHRILLHDRSIMPPDFGLIDFDESFTGVEAWAAVKTIGSGRVVFDNVGVGQQATHELFIRYDYNVSSDMFIQLDDGRRLRILALEDFEERHEYMRLICRDRGLDEAAKA